MPRLNEVQPEEATGHVKQVYDAAQNEFGAVPNLFKGLANSPVGLRAYTQLGKIISTGDLGEMDQNIVRLVVSQFNDCGYCIAAHSMECSKAGLSDDEIMAARRGESAGPKRAALIDFTTRVLETKGFIDDETLDGFRDGGYTDGNVVEVITIIAQKTLSNYFNHVHATELDFPAAPEL